MSEIVVPSMGESVSEGIISAWIKKDGEFVKSGESLFELETDKVTTEVPAQESGVLRVAIQEGTKVKIGAVVGRLEHGEAPAPVEPKVEKPAPSKPVASTVATTVVPVATAPVVAAADGLTPSQRRKLQEGGNSAPVSVALPPVLPTPSVSSGVVASAAQTSERQTRKRMTLLRQKIAERLVAVKNQTAMLTTFNEIDMSVVMELRQKYREEFKKIHGVDLSLMSFFVKAAVSALKAFPDINATIDGNDVVYNHFFDVGIAVSTDKGLMVPVLRNVGNMSVPEIERAIGNYAAKAREGTIGVSDLQGGTFTITNGGVFGSLMATPIINPPQSAILGMHAIQKRPVVRDDQVVVRPMMYVALSYDHRIVDGKESVGFLKHIKENVENPVKGVLDL